MILLAFFFPWLLLGRGLPKSKWKCKWIHSNIESLNLQCFEKLTEQSAVQICSNNLLPEIATFVIIAEPQTFDALISKACNVEWQVARQIVTQILSELLTVRVIELPELKRQAEVNNNMTPIICLHHRILSHLTKDCYVLKDMIDHVSHRNWLNKKKLLVGLKTERTIQEKVRATQKIKSLVGWKSKRAAK